MIRYTMELEMGGPEFITASVKDYKHTQLNSVQRKQRVSNLTETKV